MRFFLFLLFFCFLIIFSTQSCQKDNDPPVTDTLVISHTDTLFNSDTVYIKQPSSIFGLWIGTQDITSGPDAGRTGLYYSYELHTDSTIQLMGTGADGMTYYGNGTWSLHNTAFTAHVTAINLSVAGQKEIMTGTYDSVNYKLKGVIVDDPNTVYGATFNLEKVQ